MCFNQLPIDIDAEGRATLRHGGWSSATPPRVPPLPVATAGDSLTEFTLAPVTRIAGAMDFFATVDLPNRRVVDARASAAAFRGYEMLLRGRDPREAMDISSRVCGVCGGVHSTTSSMALDMAFPVRPPPLGIVARNIAQGAEVLYDHTLHLSLLAGPDYSERMVRRAEPSVWRRAEQAPAPRRDVHGFATIANLMSALNPVTGSLYLEAFDRTRLGMRMVSTMVGNYPHPTTLVPGGIKVLLTEESFDEVLSLSRQLRPYIKRLMAVFDDLMTFYHELRPEYAECGARDTSLLSFGRYDSTDVYDGSYAHLDAWGMARSMPPGVIMGDGLRSTSLHAINLGIEEFVDHAYYEQWSGTEMAVDPLGAPLSPFHPWNKTTQARPDGRNWKEKYTWCTAPRWDREVVETGPIARNWTLALAGEASKWNGMLQPTGHSVAFTLPADDELPELPFEWRVPARVNTLERNRARAFHLGMTLLQVDLDAQQGLELLRRGERRVWAPHTIPDEGVGAGFWEAARGALGHWLSVERQVIRNYQIITPSAFNASPRDPWGNPGPYEQAAIATPILEEITDPANFVGIDLMRAIRAFDPCMPCAVHMDTGEHVVTRDVVSCACGFE